MWRRLDGAGTLPPAANGDECRKTFGCVVKARFLADCGARDQGGGGGPRRGSLQYPAAFMSGGSLRVLCTAEPFHLKMVPWDIVSLTQRFACNSTPPPKKNTCPRKNTHASPLACRHPQRNGHDHSIVLSLSGSKLIFVLSNSTLRGLSGGGTRRTCACPCFWGVGVGA